MGSEFNPEVYSKVIWETLLSEFKREFTQSTPVFQSEWDTTHQLRRSSLALGRVMFKIVQWFQFHDQDTFIRYEISVSSGEFHLKSMVMESPREGILSDQGVGIPETSARNLGKVLGRMGGQLLPPS